MNKNILVFNAGSSSLKFSLFKLDSSLELSLIFSGEFSKYSWGWKLKDSRAISTQEYKQNLSLENLVTLSFELLNNVIGTELNLIGIGHRIVHGGNNLHAPVILTTEIISELDNNIDLAPLHQPSIIEVIKASIQYMPTVRQIGCFDTGFHCSQNPLNRIVAIPKKYTDLGIQNYGFHGLSYEYIKSVLKTDNNFNSDSKIVVAHLGSGASLCALTNFSSIATTMGFSPLSGLLMGTRAGTLDPAVIIFLQDKLGLGAREVEHILYKESGLLAVSGGLSNMKELLESEDPKAKLAIDLFVHRAVREIGSLVAELGGLDALIFTGGIGENSAEIREKIADRFTWLGLKLSRQFNLSLDSTDKLSFISESDSKIKTIVIRTNENLIIAKAVMSLGKLKY
jgi:acetate kinase